MIARYTRKEMAALWSEAHKLALMLEIEFAATEALEKISDSPLPIGVTARLREKARLSGPLDGKRIAESLEETHHDVLAFLIHVEERLGEEARFLHFGLTSSDVIDTALGMQLRDAATLILRGLAEVLLPPLRQLAEAHATTPMIGRSHGIHAEPITLGLVFAGSYAELLRARTRLVAAHHAVAVGKLSGAVGVYGSGKLSPAVEKSALEALGLIPETVATQVVARDRHAELLLALALLAAAIERLCTTLRHLQRSEVGEFEEAFARGQKGSSAMPHKKNPISAENLCGLARLTRAEASAALENIALWHERDISHSSVERVIIPDVTTVVDYMVHRAGRLLSGLVVRPQRIRRNLQAGGGLYASEKVMLALVETGLARRAAYELTQRHALAQAAENSERPPQGDDSDENRPPFYSRLAADPAIRARLSDDKLAACFDLEVHLRHARAIVERALSA